jgi:hypothetical protein
MDALPSVRRRTCERTFIHAPGVAGLPIPELVENRRRSIAMLPAGAPALNRDEALEILEQLRDALHDVRRLRAEVEARDHHGLTGGSV